MLATIGTYRVQFHDFSDLKNEIVKFNDFLQVFLDIYIILQ